MVEALREAVTVSGSQEAFASLIGITQQAVSKMLRNGRPLPERFVDVVAEATRIPRHRLRPDIDPADLSSPSLDDGSIAGDAPVVLSDRGVVSDKAGDA